jgi:hypothetical protein
VEQSFLIEDKRSVYSPEENKLVWKKDTLEMKYASADSAAISNIKDRLELQGNKWMVKTLLNEYCKVLKSNFTNDSAVQAILGKRESLENYVLKRFELVSEHPFDADRLAAVGDSIIGSTGLSKLRTEKPSAFTDFDARLEKTSLLFKDNDYDYDLAMPGKVFFTNAEKVSQSTLSWHIDSMHYFMKDYTITAESRIANPWMMVLSAFLAVGLLWVIFFFRKK